MTKIYKVIKTRWPPDLEFALDLCEVLLAPPGPSEGGAGHRPHPPRHAVPQGVTPSLV